MREIIWFLKKLRKLFLENQKEKVCDSMQLKARKYVIIAAHNYYSYDVMFISKNIL